jgi:hypothetical protein
MLASTVIKTKNPNNMDSITDTGVTETDQNNGFIFPQSRSGSRSEPENSSLNMNMNTQPAIPLPSDPNYNLSHAWWQSVMNSLSFVSNLLISNYNDETGTGTSRLSLNSTSTEEGVNRPAFSSGNSNGYELLIFKFY